MWGSRTSICSCSQRFVHRGPVKTSSSSLITLSSWRTQVPVFPCYPIKTSSCYPLLPYIHQGKPDEDKFMSPLVTSCLRQGNPDEVPCSWKVSSRLRLPLFVHCRLHFEQSYLKDMVLKKFSNVMPLKQSTSEGTEFTAATYRSRAVNYSQPWLFSILREFLHWTEARTSPRVPARTSKCVLKYKEWSLIKL